MKSSRRAFLRSTAATTMGLGLGLSTFGRSKQKKIKNSSSSLRILILGGTAFTGPHQIKYALDRGHKISIFNRGKTKPTVHKKLFDRVEHLVGDRNDNLTALESREWDAVIDNSATYPRWVRQTTEILKGNAGIYLFTSSLSVHASFDKRGLTEENPVATTDDPTVEDMSKYGALKALSEDVTRKAFRGGAIIVRPHLIVGPGDTTDRWTYWPVRIERGGEVLSPGIPSHQTQYIDARDLAEFDIHLIEQGMAGTYSAVGPLAKYSMAEMLYGIRAVVSNKVSFTWVDQEFLSENEVAPWREMTAWMPSGGEYDGFTSFDNRKAVSAGLTYRPLAQTARDTLNWWHTLPDEQKKNPKAGLAPDKEKKVLKKWKKIRKTVDLK
ncbi:MAG TPA: NAD-dependent epimerase/dehydratase family protein [Nitrospinaceae bacterium]|nr:NAD-dependent epimerase/dehydratase family protein [Nitrospinaceae bacterium]